MPEEQSRPVGLINSAAFCPAEIYAEFGQIPASFLPHSQRRLYEAQVELLRNWCDSVFLSLPESFAVPQADVEILDSLDVGVLRVPDGKNLVSSIHHSLTKLDCRNGVYLLHGDTLVLGFDDFDLDSFAVASQQGNYSWGLLVSDPPQSAANKIVLAGLFSFSNGDAFREILESEAQLDTEGPGAFVEALHQYSDKHGFNEVEVPSWLDFGHLQNLYRSRKEGASSREFNSLTFSERAVRKTGSNLEKIDAEAEWFERLPPDLRVFTPPFLGRDSSSYSLGFESNPTLQDLFVFGDLPLSTWEDIANSCFEFLAACSEYEPTKRRGPVLSLKRLSVDKTLKRLSMSSFFSSEMVRHSWLLNGTPVPSLLQILEQTSKYVKAGDPIPAVLHGDFCFSNIHYDFRQKMIKVIDPRGVELTDGEFSIYGDQRYDLAKLLHSVQGYDMILAGRYDLKRLSDFEIDFSLPDHPNAGHAGRSLSSFLVADYSLNHETVRATTIQLFLSMIPLHTENPSRQTAFLANALRLYLELED